MDWTILRSSWFCQNFSESFFLDPILAGQVALPVVGSIAEPFVDVEDIAEIAVAALTDSQHSRQLYEITGSKALTFPEAISEIARATGREIAFVPVSADDYRSELVRQSVPDDYIELILYLFGTVLDGRNTPLADGVQRALGRPPRDLSDVKEWLFAALASVEAASQPWSFFKFSGDTDETPMRKFFDSFLEARLKHMENVLAGREWLVGTFSVADILMADVLRLVDRFDGLAAYPACRDYVVRATARPSFVKAHAEQMAHFAAAD